MSMTVREQMLLESWRSLRKRKCISMDELDALMYQIEKLLMNYRVVEESRNQWRKKYKELKNANKI